MKCRSKNPFQSKEYLLSRIFRISTLPLLFTTLFFGCWAGNLQYTIDKPTELKRLSLEELMNVEFVTVFKKPGQLFDTPAAVYSLTEEDIQRTGITNIPDALRMIPGIQVAQHDANSWAVTSRGFSGLSRGISGQFANKLLVLSDGRSVYTPLFSGVSWETQDVLLDDVDRIEVVRGPGATLWGANAVNGVINIISKNAHETQGGLLSAGGGSTQRGFGHFRYGGEISENSYYRVYGKYLKVNDLVDSTGHNTVDGWHMFRSGFRIDWDKSRSNQFTFQGDAYEGKAGQRYNIINSMEPPFQQSFDFDATFNGQNILARWTHAFSVFSDLSFQFYFDRVKREEAVVKGTINTLDFDFQHRWLFNTRQEIIWGAGFRYVSDDFDSTFAFYLFPGKRNVKLLNVFFQDEIALVRNRLHLTLGSKFEHNDFTGLEIQPGARLLWKPTDQQAVWGAVSRAVRTPSRSEVDASIVSQALRPTYPTTFIVQRGSRDFKAESLLAFDVGYRVRPTEALSFDLASFYNVYDNLHTNEPSSEVQRIPGSENLFQQIIVANKMYGRTYGVELSAGWQAFSRLRFDAAYSFLHMRLELDKSSKDLVSKSLEGQSPSHQLFLRSRVDLTNTVALDLRTRYVDSLPSQGVASYFTADFNLSWRMSRGVELSIVGQNLIDNYHSENNQFINIKIPQIMPATQPSQVERGVYSRIKWQF
ncbi:MAG: TonB-dependent receptor plug domain-containing protein [bacterium]